MRALPGEQRMGRLTVSVSAGRAARMFAAANWREPHNAGGGAVFAGREDAIAENLPSEPDPADPPSGRINLDVHIHDVDSGHPVPYLDVRSEVSRNGAVVFADLEMVPVARPRKGVAGLHYGNNIALDAPGSYQVVVTIAASPLTGTEGDQRCAFSLDLDGETSR